MKSDETPNHHVGSNSPVATQRGWLIVSVTLSALILAACSDPEIRVYDVPKDQGHVSAPTHEHQHPDTTEGTTGGTLPEGHPPIDGMPRDGIVGAGELPPGHPTLGDSASGQNGGFGGMTTDRGMQQLPAGASGSGETPRWEVPSRWSEGTPSSIRRGSYVFSLDSNRQAEIAVTTFPGDVGGELANVNRWRQQVGLGPINEAALEEVIERFDVNGRQAWMVALAGPETTTLAAAVRAGNDSWFFRMTGHPEAVSEGEADFRAFLKSVRFP